LQLNLTFALILDDPVPESVKEGSDKQKFEWLNKNVEEIFKK